MGVLNNQGWLLLQRSGWAAEHRTDPGGAISAGAELEQRNCWFRSNEASCEMPAAWPAARAALQEQ